MVGTRVKTLFKNKSERKRLLFYSLTFAEQLLQSKYIASGSMGTLSHTDAQKNFINSRPSSTEQDIGMIIEGSFWENECADMNYFNVAEKQYGEAFSRENRSFALMPYPKATEDEVGDKVTLTDSLISHSTFCSFSIPMSRCANSRSIQALLRH